MNFPYFIAKKVATNQATNGQRSFSGLIIRISIVAVALSVAVMILTTALIRGFKNEIRSKIFGFFGHIHITDFDAAEGFEDAYPININQNFYPYLDTVEQVEYLDQYLLFGREFGKPFWRTTKAGISHIQSFAMKPGIIKAKEDMEGIILKGVGKDFNWEFMRAYLLEGDIFEVSDSNMSRKIIISQQTADRLNLKVGDRTEVNFVGNSNIIRRRLEISGIYRTGLEEYDRRFALVDIAQIQRLLGWQRDEVGGFEVFVEDVDDIPIFREYIAVEQFPIPTSLYAESIRQKQPAIFEWLELQNINERIIIALMLIVSIINMMTALMILILERTNMVGTLKALGTSNWKIRKIFLYYAAYIIGLGLFWGNLVGIGLGFLQDQFRFIKLSEANYYLSYAPIEFNFWTIFSLNVLTLVVILLFLIIPSYLVTRINPVEAIRFK
ncbi:MAG: FtsX-like permease family protein [Bacteroidota bacterium]